MAVAVITVENVLIEVDVSMATTDTIEVAVALTVVILDVVAVAYGVAVTLIVFDFSIQVHIAPTKAEAYDRTLFHWSAVGLAALFAYRTVVVIVVVTRSYQWD